MSTAYKCSDCGYVYGVKLPSLPTVSLHRVVSHDMAQRGATPIVEVTK